MEIQEKKQGDKMNRQNKGSQYDNQDRKLQKKRWQENSQKNSKKNISKHQTKTKPKGLMHKRL